MEDIVNLILNSSVSIIVIAFFMYRDLKFNTQLNQTLVTLIDAVNVIKDMLDNKEKD